MKRTWLAGALIAATTVSGALPVPAFAADPPEPLRCEELQLSTGLLTPRALTLHLLTASPYSAVRAAAQSTINAGTTAAIGRFIPRGWCEATRRAEQDAAMNDHIIARVLATHAYEISPWVYSAAEAAKYASAPEKEYFVRFGLAEARAADQRVRDEDRAYADALTDDDIAYVRTLSESPTIGENVRLAAAWAVVPEEDPKVAKSKIVEFYTYAWASFGKLDLERFQVTTADQEMRWYKAVDNLKTAALEAQAAALRLEGEAKRAKLEEAADAWAGAAAGAGSSVSQWQTVQETANAQAQQWYSVYLEALTSDSPNWKAMQKPARANRDAWNKDLRAARDRATYWQQVLNDALAAEEDIRSEL